MKKFLLALLASILCACGVGAQAESTITNVTIAYPEPLASGVVILHFSGDAVGSPACATTKNAYVIDGSTKEGATALAVVLEFYVLGHTVSGAGSGTCKVLKGYETFGAMHPTDVPPPGQSERAGPRS